MQKNMGTLDRVARLVVGLLICGFGGFYLTTTWLSILLVVLGVFMIIESLIGWCALYALIGKNTCPIDSNPNVLGNTTNNNEELKNTENSEQSM